jgi:hypothetical protein
VDPRGKERFGQVVCPNRLPAFAEGRFRQGWRALVVFAGRGPVPPQPGDPAVMVAGIERDADGKRIWWAQLVLFNVPAPPAKRTHTWMWRPGLSECRRCGQLWFSGASRAEVVAFLTKDCPVFTVSRKPGRNIAGTSVRHYQWDPPGPAGGLGQVGSMVDAASRQ